MPCFGKCARALIDINSAIRPGAIVFGDKKARAMSNCERHQASYQSAHVLAWQSRGSILIAALAYIALGANTDAGAQSAVSPPGRLLASNCSQCHGTTAAAPGFDKLTGKSASKLYKKLKEFQSGGEGENIMARHAMGFTDAQLRELAQWLSTQK